MAWPAAVLPCFISRFLYRPQEEREERTRDFENKRKARETLMAAAIEIPPHILGEKKEQPPPNPDAVFT